MASLYRRGNSYSIAAQTRHGRKVVGVGNLPKRDVTMLRGVVEQLEQDARTSATPTPAVVEWLKQIDDRMYSAVERLGLVGPRVNGETITSAPLTVARLTREYISSRSDVSDRSRSNMEQAAASIVRFFGAGRVAGSITAGDAKDWQRRELERYSVATVSGFVKKVRQIFADAVDRRLLVDNPFKATKIGSFLNRDRIQFIDRATFARVMEAAPSIQWRAMLALARFGALRVPSELAALKWSAVDWSTERLHVWSPKTKTKRVIPLFPEIAVELRDLHESLDADAGDAVFPRVSRDANLRTHLIRILERATVKPWPRLWHNMRASRQTELTASFPAHVVCEWIGNSEAVAKKHYLSPTPDDFQRALKLVAPDVARNTIRVASSARTERAKNEKSGKKPDSDVKSIASTAGKIPPTGFEPVSRP
jgi:integrase